MTHISNKAAASALAVVVVLLASACSLPSSAMRAIRSQAVLSHVPDGVKPEPVVEIPGKPQVDLFDSASRRFVADDEKTLAKAGHDMFDFALADGWTGPPLSDPGDSGVFGTTLEKGELELDISYQTAQSFDLLKFDDDVLALDINVATRSPDGGH